MLLIRLTHGCRVKVVVSSTYQGMGLKSLNQANSDTNTNSGVRNFADFVLAAAILHVTQQTLQYAILPNRHFFFFFFCNRFIFSKLYIEYQGLQRPLLTIF